MPRRPKPTHLKLVEGTRDRRPGSLKRGEPTPPGDLFEPPEHFADDLKGIWRDVIAAAPKGLLKRLDGAMLEGWVIAYAVRLKALKTWEEAQRQLLMKTPGGAVLPNALLSTINRQTVIMKSLAAELGFSPAARARVSVDDEGGEGDAAARFFK